MSSIKALIVAGGKSSRLGGEKAFVNYHGKPQVIHLHDMLKSLHREVYISCNQSQKRQFQDICPVVVDPKPSIGPMGGIFTAMSAYPGYDWLVVACDMPMVTRQTLFKLLDHQQDKPVTTYKSERKAFPEVLLTIYKKELFSAFEEAIESESYSLQTLLKSVETHFILPENENELANVNTMEDLKRIQGLIKDRPKDQQ